LRLAAGRTERRLATKTIGDALLKRVERSEILKGG
jgi:hypothetical protein